MTLSNRQKADVLERAYRNAPHIDNGLYHIRLAFLTIFSGTAVSGDRVANYYAPPGRPLGSGAWSSLQHLIDAVATDPDVDMKMTQMFLLLTDY
ncbi:hypothetical protein [Pseudomonas guariconensis]|uniref:hypothetical protein n=1 Tax=Pseudomonas guariconensis TaxID=1288410 RepID=UPI00300D0BC0